MAKTLKSISRENIIDVAINLIAHRKIEEISLKNIAEEVGIAKGTLYYYFKSKEDVVLAIVDNYLDALEKQFFDWISDSTKDTSLGRMINYILLRGARGTNRVNVHIYLVNQALLESNNDIKVKFAKRYELWKTRLVSELASRMDYNQEKAKDVCELLLAIMDGMIVHELLNISTIDTEKVANLIVKGIKE